MKMRSRVVVTYDIETEHNIPEPQFEDTPDVRHDKTQPRRAPGQEMVNADEVEQARVQAVRDLEQQMRERFSGEDVVDVAIAEVAQT
jgi:hypothetical protein